jgi:hypothetical protein
MQHPKSPIASRESRYARPGGRPIIDEHGRILAPAQDSAGTYGSRLRMYHIIVLSRSAYDEVPFFFIEPDSSGPAWISSRLHHLDAWRVSPGHWIAAMDGDSQVGGNPVRYTVYAIIVLVIMALVRYRYFALLELSVIEYSKRNRHRANAITLAGFLVVIACVAFFLGHRRWYTVPPVRVMMPSDDPVGAPMHAKSPELAWRAPVPRSGKLWPGPGIQVDNPSRDAIGRLDGPCPVTLVTAMIDIGRGTPLPGGEPPRSFQKYLSQLEQVLAIDTCLVVYLDPAYIPWARRLRARFSYSDFREFSQQDMLDYRHVPAMQRVIDDADFMAHVNRPGRPELHLVGYNVVMFSKVDWTFDASVRNVFNSSYFFWVDGGYGHGNEMYVHEGKPWPHPERVRALVNQHQIIQVRQRDFQWHVDCRIPSRERFMRHMSHVAGGFFGGTAKAIKQLHEEFNAAVMESVNGGYMDDDQSVFFEAFCRNPSLFNYIRCNQRLGCDLIHREVCEDGLLCPIGLFSS